MEQIVTITHSTVWVVCSIVLNVAILIYMWLLIASRNRLKRQLDGERDLYASQRECLKKKHAEYSAEVRSDLIRLNELHNEFKAKTDELIAELKESNNELEYTVDCQSEKIECMTAQLKERTSESRQMALSAALSQGSDDVVATAKKYHRFLMGKE